MGGTYRFDGSIPDSLEGIEQPTAKEIQAQTAMTNEYENLEYRRGVIRKGLSMTPIAELSGLPHCQDALKGISRVIGGKIRQECRQLSEGPTSDLVVAIQPFKERQQKILRRQFRANDLGNFVHGSCETDGNPLMCYVA